MCVVSLFVSICLVGWSLEFCVVVSFSLVLVSVDWFWLVVVACSPLLFVPSLLAFMLLLLDCLCL